VGRIAVLTPLRHVAFRYLFAGQLISDIGDWLDFLALVALIAYHWDLGPGALAAVVVAAALPSVLVGPVAGVWVDRLPRKLLMIGADLGRAAIVLGLVWAPNLESVLVLVFLKFTLSAVFGPARQATIRTIVPDEDLLSANGLSQLSIQGTKVLGPIIGGVIVSIAGPRAAFVVDSLTFLISAACLTQLPARSAIPEPAASHVETEEAAVGQGLWAEFSSGLEVIFKRRALGVAVLGMAAALFMIFTFDGIGPLALRDLGVGEQLLGLAIGSIGLGTAVGAVVVSQWGGRSPPFMVMGGGMLVAGGLVACVGVAALVHLAADGLAWIPVWLAIGLSGAAVFVPYGYILQRETPPEMMGRVFASANGVQTAFQLSAPVLGAALAEITSIGLVLAVFGVGLSLVGVVVTALRPPLGASYTEVRATKTSVA
jgi:MFS family permease